MKMKQILSTIFIFLFSISVGFSSWVIPLTSTDNISFKDSSDSKTKSVAYIKGFESTQYLTIEKAVESANALANTNNQLSVYVIPSNVDNVTNVIDITRSVLIGDYVSLIFPFVNEQYNSVENNEWKTLPKSYADSTNTLVNKNRKILVNLTNKSELTISKLGKLIIGGEFYGRGVSKRYAEINIKEGSKITCFGSVWCGGFIKESNIDQTSIDIRSLTIKDGGLLTGVISIYDPKGGSIHSSLHGAGICPLSIFDFANIQTKVIFDYGSAFDAIARIDGTSTQQFNETIKIIRKIENKTTDKAIFYQGSGVLAFEYSPTNKELSNSENITYIECDGNIEIGTLYVNVGVAIDSSKYFLPLSYKFKIKAKENSVINITNKVKLYPGCEINIEKNATINISSSLITYQGDSLDGIDSSLGVIYPANKGDAKLIIDGILKLSSDAFLGAQILTTNATGDAKIDISSISSEKNLIVTSLEGTMKKEVIIVTSVQYYDEVNNVGKNAELMPGNIINSSIPNIGYWDSTFLIKTFVLNIKIKKTTFANTIFSYDLKISDNVNGTSATELVSNSTTESSFDLSSKKYFNLVINRAKGVSFTKQTNNDVFSSDNRYPLNGDYELMIDPNEAVNVKVSTIKGESGAGGITNEVYESTDNKVTGNLILSTGYDFNTKIIKDAWFKLKTNGGTYKVEEITIGNGNTIPFKVDTYYQATSDVKILRSGGSCIEGDALITLYDNTIKFAKDIVLGDMLKTWSFEIGDFESKPVFFIEKRINVEVSKVTLFFDNRKSATFINSQSYFDTNERDILIISDYDAEKAIGKSIMTFSGNLRNSSKIVDVKVEQTTLDTYEFVTGQNYNYIYDDIFTQSPIFNSNFFYVNEDFKRDPRKKNEDISNYGLYTYDDFKEITEEVYFDLLNIKYMKVGIAKGYLTYEDLLNFFHVFLEKNS